VYVKQASYTNHKIQEYLKYIHVHFATRLLYEVHENLDVIDLIIVLLLCGGLLILNGLHSNTMMTHHKVLLVGACSLLVVRRMDLEEFNNCSPRQSQGTTYYGASYMPKNNYRYQGGGNDLMQVVLLVTIIQDAHSVGL